MAEAPFGRRHPILNYENGLLLLLGVSFGCAFFDRNAASVLIPYIAKDLGLSNTQSALINSVLSITWALGAYVIARWSDARGDVPPFLSSKRLWSLIPGKRLDVKRRFSQEQIIGFLRAADKGVAVKELCRKHGFSEANYYLWRSKFGGMEVSDAKRLRALEGELINYKRVERLYGLEISGAGGAKRFRWRIDSHCFVLVERTRSGRWTSCLTVSHRAGP
jgi:putative transposase